MTEKDYPNIFDYDDYRSFLRDFYISQKSKKRGFSYRFFSRIAGFRSPNILKRVIDGQQNLTLSSINRFIKAIGLSFDEGTFYKNLVLFNQSKSVEEKQKFAREIVFSRAYKKLKPMAKVQYEYWSNWYNVVIRELVTLDEFREDPEWIAETLNPPITPDEAKRSLDLLLQLGLLKRNSQGKLMQDQTLVLAEDGVLSASVSQFHREMIGKAKESLDRFPLDERHLSTLTFAMSQKEYKEMLEMVQNFNKLLIEKARQARAGERVFQINTQAFPLTQTIKRIMN